MFNFTSFFVIFLIYNIISVKEVASEQDYGNKDVNVFWKGLSKDEVRLKQAETIQKYLNTSVNPCENFFEYACGNWIKYNYQEDFRSSEDYKRIVNLTGAIEIFVRSLYQENIITNRDQVHTAEEKLKIYYSSCVNEIQKEKTDFMEFYKIVEPYGGSPLWDPNWKSENFDWLKLETFGVITKIPIFLDRRLFNTDRVLFVLNPKIEYGRNEQQEKYKEFIWNILKLTGIDDKIAKETANEIIKIESELQVFFNYGIKSTTVQDFINQHKENDWTNYFLKVNASNFAETIRLSNKMPEIFEYISNQKPENIANFMYWHILKTKINLFDERYRNELEKYETGVGKYVEENSKEDFIHSECFNDVSAGLPSVPGVLFFNKYFENGEKELTEITEDIKESLKIVFNTNNWLDNDMKQDAVNNFKELVTIVNRPQLDSIAKLNNVYNDLQVIPNNYFENWFKANQFDHNRYLQGSIVDFEWRDPSFGFFDYIKTKNIISVTYSYLHPPYFHPKFPRALNFGGIGVSHTSYLIHKIPFIHESEGPWHEKVNKSTECFPSHYFDARAKAIAYNAIRTSFNSYKAWLKNSNDITNEQLPGLDITPEKLFFISYAQNHCMFSYNQINNDFDMTILKNLQEFADTFSCSIEDDMNPEKKCDINI